MCECLCVVVCVCYLLCSVGLPGYTELGLVDQVHLIECCWLELLLLNCAFQSMEYGGHRLVFAPDFHLDRYLRQAVVFTFI